MKTSNYSRSMSLPGAIRISLGARIYNNVYFKGPAYEPLMPPADLLAWWKASPKGMAEQAEYAVEYKARVLACLRPAEVVSDLTALVGGHEPVLLCHCGKGKFCHRLLVAEWLGDAGIVVQEI
jgi:hypothetical protein